MTAVGRCVHGLHASCAFEIFFFGADFVNAFVIDLHVTDCTQTTHLNLNIRSTAILLTSGILFSRLRLRFESLGSRGHW